MVDAVLDTFSSEVGHALRKAQRSVKGMEDIGQRQVFSIIDADLSIIDP